VGISIGVSAVKDCIGLGHGGVDDGSIASNITRQFGCEIADIKI
jgi:hypothetical protein